jgi:hypothetical protein
VQRGHPDRGSGERHSKKEVRRHGPRLSMGKTAVAEEYPSSRRLLPMG